MPRKTPRLRLAVVPAVALLLAGAASNVASAAPPLLERLAQYRILDASGRVAYAPKTDATGRIVLRPAYPPPLLLRSKPFVLTGYAGAQYGPIRDRYETTGYLSTRDHGSHHGHFWSGR
jgi:hypothetical protein